VASSSAAFSSVGSADRTLQHAPTARRHAKRSRQDSDEPVWLSFTCTMCELRARRAAAAAAAAVVVVGRERVMPADGTIDADGGTVRHFLMCRVRHHHRHTVPSTSAARRSCLLGEQQKAGDEPTPHNDNGGGAAVGGGTVGGGASQLAVWLAVGDNIILH
jgi:hypothetical protein